MRVDQRQNLCFVEIRIQMASLKIHKVKPISTRVVTRKSAKAVVPAPKSRSLRNLAPFNAPPPHEEGSNRDDAKRTRQVVSFFEPDFSGQSYIGRKDINGSGSDDNHQTSSGTRKRRGQADVEYDSSIRKRRSTTTTRLSISSTKDVEEKPRMSNRRLSRKATRRLATNALVGYLQRHQTKSDGL